MGLLEDSGYPEYDLEKAKELVAQYEQESGNDFSITLSNTTDPDTVATGDMLEEMLTEAGIDVNRNQFEQAQLINNALGGTFDMLQWRNHPGGDPAGRSEEHTSELQSLMRISYAVFCLQKKTNV